MPFRAKFIEKGDVNLKFTHQLDLSQKQKQKMTAQLLQSIQLLQFSQQDLLAYLNQKTLENPFLSVETRESDATEQSFDKNDLGWIADTKQTLRSFLTDQVLLAYRETYLREMIFWWINQLDDRGYVTKTIDQAANETEADSIQMLDALTLLQQLEPAGVGARNLQECLMLQTERNDNAPNIAYIVLEESFDELVHRKWKSICKKYDVSLQNVQNVFDFIQHLSPSPGEIFKTDNNSLIRPDLVVRVKNNELVVQEAKYHTPLLSFKDEYASQLKKYEDKEVNQYIKEKKKEYEVLQESLRLRNETILRVGVAIVQHQKKFFFDKDANLDSLQLVDLAEELSLHESTISRAVQDTYIQTENGTFELRNFFSRRSSSTGHSTDSILHALQKLIDNEDKKKPLSDQKIVDLLMKNGFELSRRTAAKYRTQLNIPSSSKRKRF